MIEIAFCQFISIEGIPEQFRFQNFYPGETKFWRSYPYIFMPFDFNGSQGNLQGSNESTRITLPSNEMTLKVVQALAGFYLSPVWIYQAYLDPFSMEPYEYDKVLEFYYRASHSVFDTRTVTIELISAIDASIVGQVPARSYNEITVGITPVNAGFTIRR